MQESTPEKLSFSGSTSALQRSRPQLESLSCSLEGVDPGNAGVDPRKTQFFWVDPSPPKESTPVQFVQFCSTGVDPLFVLESTLTLLESTPAKVGVDPELQKFLKIVHLSGLPSWVALVLMIRVVVSHELVGIFFERSIEVGDKQVNHRTKKSHQTGETKRRVGKEKRHWGLKKMFSSNRAPQRDGKLPLKWNTDGAMKQSGIAGEGGILRDHKGNFIFALSHSYGTCSSLIAEARAFLDALRYISKLSCKVATDPKILVDIIQNKVKCPWKLIYYIRTNQSLHGLLNSCLPHLQRIIIFSLGSLYLRKPEGPSDLIS
ncbi:hypothetical protein Taro_049317 [Colocasia esculenta]|uniref:RNase H type-1 domain-containing protein n=1 Tax=Colocasia esculenta TaxID=4460 RepID=A0A843XAI2_COLES|nr:hypothetical protein [Colocasia esculenta]